MRRAALLLTVVASSCVLPQFEIVPSPDDAGDGSASGANGSSAAAGAGASAATPSIPEPLDPGSSAPVPHRSCSMPQPAA